MSFIKRAALYIRVSSDEQARHGLSLGEQRADLMRYAESHGYAVASVYADEGVSARKPMRVRKELQRLLSDVKQKKIDIIVIKCLDRWFRNIADYHKVQEILDEYGVNWECSQDRYDTTTAAGRLNLNIRLAIAQDEADRTSERIKYVFNGKRERKELLNGRPPIGYVVNEKKQLAVNEQAADVVRYVFQNVCDGVAIFQMPRKVYENFGVSLSIRQMGIMLHNRTYIGEMYGIPDYCPEIIDADVFERVQEITSHHVKPPHHGRVYLFGGLIVCPCCGRRLVSRYSSKTDKNGNPYMQYYCQRSLLLATDKRCGFKRTLFERKLERYLLDNLQGFIAQHTLAVNESRTEKQKKMGGITIESINAKMTRLKDLYVDGLISKDTYITDREKLQKELSELSRAIDTMPTVAPALQAIAAGEDFRAAYEVLTRENKREFWRSIIKCIEFDDTPDTRGPRKIIPYRVTFLWEPLIIEKSENQQASLIKI